MLVSPSSMRAPSSVLAIDAVKDTSSMYYSGLLGAQKCPRLLVVMTNQAQ